MYVPKDSMRQRECKNLEFRREIKVHVKTGWAVGYKISSQRGPD
jgi:hypothetical protein